MYIKSTTSKTYTVAGHSIPGTQVKGNKYLNLDDATWATLKKNPVIAGLIKNGDIFETADEPKEFGQVDAGTVGELRSANKLLKAELEKVQNELKKANASDSEPSVPAATFEELKKEANDTIAAKDAEIEELKKQLAAASKGKGKPKGGETEAE